MTGVQTCALPIYIGAILLPSRLCGEGEKGVEGGSEKSWIFLKEVLDIWRESAIISLLPTEGDKKNSEKLRANMEKSRSLVERARLEIV